MAKKGKRQAKGKKAAKTFRPAPMADSPLYKQKAPGKKSPVKLFVTLGVLLLAFVGLSSLLFNRTEAIDYSEFTQCVTAKGVTLYGAYWCPNCAKVKRTLGDAYGNLNYVECDPNGQNAQPDVCLRKGIQLYHTFEYGNGDLGVRDSPVQLAEKSGCSLPEGAPEQWRG